MLSQSDVEASPEASDDQLMATALRGRDTPERTAALKALLRRRSPQVRPILGKIVTDSASPPELRTTAAAALGREAGAENEQALRAALAGPDASVVATAAESLGRIGGRASLETLANAAAKAPPGAARSLAFARTLISYRLGVGTDRLAEPPATTIVELDRDRSETLPVESVGAEAFRAARPSLERELPAIAVTDKASVRLVCGHERLWVVLGDGMVQGDAGGALATDRVAAVVLKESSCPDGWYVREYILAHPTADGAALFGVRPSGRVVHFGVAKGEKSAASFRLRAVDAPGVPAVELAGDLLGEEGSLVVREALAGPSRGERRGTPSPPRPGHLPPRPAD